MLKFSRTRAQQQVVLVAFALEHRQQQVVLVASSWEHCQHGVEGEVAVQRLDAQALVECRAKL